MKRFTIVLLFIIFIIIPANATAWQIKLGPYLPGLFYSVGPVLPGLGVPAGQYGGGRIVVIDSETAEWCNWTRLPVGAGHESVSAFQLIDDAGLNAWTESDAGAQCWTAWRAEGWRWGHTQTFPGWPWALAGPTAAKQGWIALSEGRKKRTAGGWLAAWGADRWEPITPIIPDLIIWDATPWGDDILLGCSIGNGQYLDEWAGRLVLVQSQNWRLVNLPAMAGVIRVARLKAWPDRLWLCTLWGEVWWTDDLENFALWHRQDYGKQHDAFLHELDGYLIVAETKGQVWKYTKVDSVPERIANIPNVDFMSLSPFGRALVGVLTEKGATKSRPIVIFQKGE